MEKRKCNKCSKTKPLDQFGRTWNYKNKDKSLNIKMYYYRKKCELCRKKERSTPEAKQHQHVIRTKHYLENKDKTLKRSAKYYSENKEKYRVQRKKYRETHKEELREWSKQWRIKNKDLIRCKQRESRQKRKKLAVKHLGDKCVDCVKDGKDGIFHQDVYDFHHKDPNQKDFSISNLLDTSAWHKIIKELDKCLLLCANCHRNRHATQES